MLSLNHGRGSCQSVALCLTSTLEMLHLVFRQTGGQSSKMFLNYWYPSKLLQIYCRWNQCLRSGFRLCRDVDSTTIYQHLFFPMIWSFCQKAKALLSMSKLFLRFLEFRCILKRPAAAKFYFCAV